MATFTINQRVNAQRVEGVFRQGKVIAFHPAEFDRKGKLVKEEGYDVDFGAGKPEVYEIPTNCLRRFNT